MIDMTVVWSVAAGLMVLALWLVAVAAWQWLRTSKRAHEMGIESESMRELAAYAESFVVSAAKQFHGQSGEAKRKWVLGQLAKYFPGIDPELARAALEEAYADYQAFRQARIEMQPALPSGVETELKEIAP